MHNIMLPELGEGVAKATIACWHVKIGDRVSADDDVVELVTDKASFNVPADVEGVVEQILFPEGQEVEIGSTLAVIKNDE